MNADYFKQLSEPAAQPKKADPAILAEKVQKYLAAGKTITVVPRGVTGVVLAPMGIKRTGFKGAQK
jgi:ribosomal protein L18E